MALPKVGDWIRIHAGARNNRSGFYQEPTVALVVAIDDPIKDSYPIRVVLLYEDKPDSDWVGPTEFDSIPEEHYPLFILGMPQLVEAMHSYRNAHYGTE